MATLESECERSVNACVCRWLALAALACEAVASVIRQRIVWRAGAVVVLVPCPEPLGASILNRARNSAGRRAQTPNTLALENYCTLQKAVVNLFPPINANELQRKANIERACEDLNLVSPRDGIVDIKVPKAPSGGGVAHSERHLQGLRGWDRRANRKCPRRSSQ